MIIDKLFNPVQLGTVATLLYTTPSQKRVMISKVTVANTTAAAVTFALYLVPKGDTAGVTNIIVPTRTIEAYGTYDCLSRHVIESGDKLYGLASVAAAVTVHGSGVRL